MTARVFDNRPCALGEGPLWHPERHQFFWFDILQNRLLSRDGNKALQWQFDENVSAAGWTGRDTLLIAGETGLFQFDLGSASAETVCPLEADNPATRPNDGRADPMGGFWIGTMAKRGHSYPGAIYRYYRGELRQIHTGVETPNSICFAPDGRQAYFCNTGAGRIMTQPLGRDGWPAGAPQVFADLRADGLNPDGSVVAADGTLWNAQWGAGRIAAYSTGGSFLRAIAIPGINSSCPAFGGPGYATLLCTTARQDLSADTIAAHPENGMTFTVDTDAIGLPEPRVIL